MSRYLIDELENRPQVELMTYTEIVELKGEPALEAVVVVDSADRRARASSRPRRCSCSSAPIAHTDWLRGHVAMDEHCFVLTGRDLPDERSRRRTATRPPLFLETSQPGIFAVGDVHSGSVKRVASAVGEGSMAVRLVHQRLASR